ncbi:FMN-binding protein [Aureibaculum sp. 2210JD6-5]|uniref:FMN-binding protein n=1 Tax=Aureibaculum sp. 2210JD6-5 TaxID=3103957 RepID=UPI002AADA607|nr:FMN-binding protein [Aureibaculum sp. 2210JD6-5]MDY7396586.1 FMN-binding protein [Aureibaculum sp. 2210JD6-5]
MIFCSRVFLLLCLASITVNALQLPKNIQKKVDKEIRSAFDIEEYTLGAIEVSKEVNAKSVTKITKNNLYKIIKSDTVIGYAFIDKAPSKTDQFDYLVLFDKELILKKSKVLIYREEYGGEISSKRWLKQFEGKNSSEQLKYEKDIIAISGATISAKSMTVAINNLLKTVDILQKNNCL